MIAVFHPKFHHRSSLICKLFEYFDRGKDLTDVTLREALDTVGLLSKTVWRAVTLQIIFFYPKETR